MAISGKPGTLIDRDDPELLSHQALGPHYQCSGPGQPLTSDGQKSGGS
jgi:hypothetical protein